MVLKKDKVKGDWLRGCAEGQLWGKRGRLHSEEVLGREGNSL